MRTAEAHKLRRAWASPLKQQLCASGLPQQSNEIEGQGWAALTACQSSAEAPLPKPPTVLDECRTSVKMLCCQHSLKRVQNQNSGLACRAIKGRHNR